MAKQVINAFNSGEVSPSTYARYDQQSYDSACLKLENFIPMQAGGVERRPATKYLSTLSSSTNVTYPFVFNNSNTYNLIFSNETLVIYSDETIKATLTSPYLTAELYDLKITQSADVVFITHPNHAVRQLSRLADTSWTLNILDFKVPPLLDEDANKTFSITGSATKGSTITIISNTDLFTTDHIGGKFLIKQLRDDSNSILIGANVSGSTAESDYFVSDSINVSMSNWSIETRGTWRGVVTILRSEDGGDTYEEYVRLADTSAEPKDGHDPDTDTTSNKNFSFSSTEPEPLGALLKVQYTQPDETDTTYDNFKDFSFELKTEDPYLYGLCLITGRTSGTEATATLETPLAYTITDFGTTWGNSTEYAKGAKVTFGGTLTVTEISAGSPYFAQLNDESGAALSDNYTAQGMAYADSKLWVLVTASSDGSGTQKVYSYTIANQGTSSLAYSYSANVTLSGTNLDFVTDIAYYNSELYIWGKRDRGTSSNYKWQSHIYKYNTSGVYQSTFYSNTWTAAAYKAASEGTRDTYGLGFDGSFFYATRLRNQMHASAGLALYSGITRTHKINTSGTEVASKDHQTFCNQSTGTSTCPSIISGTNNPKDFADWTAIQGNLYALNDNNDKWDKYDTTMGDLGVSVSIGQTVASEMKGTGYNSTTEKLYGVQSNGMIIEFGFQGGAVYYQATAKHNSSSTAFSTWLAQGFWVQRFPESVTFQEGAYSDHRGYPHSIAIYESRLCFGGTDTNPNTIWLSRTNDLDNFQTGVNANDSMRLTINSNTIDEIRWLCPSNSLIIGTSANEWALGSGSDQLAVTPTQLNIKRQSNYGSSKIQGELVNASILFFMRQKTKLREWIQQNTANVFLAADLAAFADQATEGGILQMAVQTQPETIIWMVRNDGQLIGLTYEKETKTFGWHRHTFKNASGVLEKAESVSVLPTATGEDCVYVILKKADDERCYVKMDSRNWGTTYTTDYNGLDNYVTYTNFTGSTLGSHTISSAISNASNFVTLVFSQPHNLSVGDSVTLASLGSSNTDPNGTHQVSEVLDATSIKFDLTVGTGETYTHGSATCFDDRLQYLANDTVTFKIDGATVSTAQVNNTNYSLPVGSQTNANLVVGLPYTSTIAPLYLGLEYKSGTTRGDKVGVKSAMIRFKDTLSAKVGQSETASDLQTIEFASTSSLNSEDVPCYLSNANEYLQTVYVIQDEPQPCTVLGMVINLDIGKGNTS